MTKPLAGAPTNVCIFCPSPLDENTRPEHVIASAIGGRLMSSEIVCNTCNGELGRQVDKPLADDTEQLRYFLRIRRGDRDPPPSIRAGSEHGPVMLRPDGPAEPARSNADAAPTDEGFQISVSGKDESVVVDRMVHKLRELGVKSVEEIEKRFSFASYVNSHKPFKHVIMLKTSIGGDANFRAIGKAAFELLALRQRVAIHDGRFDEVRKFVRHGMPSDCTMWDYVNGPPLPFEEAALGPAYHSVLVWAHPGQPALGAVTLFGGLRFTTRLCEAWWGDAFAVAHAVNPTEASRSRSSRLRPCLSQSRSKHCSGECPILTRLAKPQLNGPWRGTSAIAILGDARQLPRQWLRSRNESQRWVAWIGPQRWRSRSGSRGPLQREVRPRRPSSTIKNFCER